MNPALQSAIATGVVGVLLLLLSQRANRRSETATNALESRKVDAEGKAVDLSVLLASINDLKDRLGTVEEDLVDERESRVVAMQRAEDAEKRAVLATERAERLERRVTLLEDTLRAHDIAVPVD